ncbi:hypothetical protein KDL01_17415 [Actinospica durhamensis]|uniref:Uncharacterized protein n=1 Tax=Actinospica durhamensis TaxID=1508375 RepID=A0A941EQ28_9ACTN|nr:hypothetical protein [Actinospica durhamensis]MBR7835058.1 hypothetical protein [Actinospica durhamensis]
MSFDSVLHDHLTELADEAAPPCSVVVGEGIAAGRRKANHRLAAGIGGGALAVTAAAAIGVPALLGTGAAPTAKGNTGGVLPAASSTPATVGTKLTGGTDPLSVTAEFGWLPAALTTVSAQADPQQPGTTLYATTADLSTSVELTVLPAGAHVPATHFKGGILAPHTSAPSVNGHTAYWTFVPGSSEAAADGSVDLVWEYKPNAWATLELDSVDDTGTDVISTVYKITDSITFGSPVAKPLPFQLSSPLDLPVTDAESSHSTSAPTGNGWLTFGAPGAKSPGSGTLTILTAPAGTLIPKQSGLYGSDQSLPGPTQTSATVGDQQALQSVTPTGTTRTSITVDGHQAQLLTTRGAAQLIVLDVNGQDLELSADGPELNTINAAGGLVAYYHTITWLGSNLANWSTSVLN